MQKYDLVVIGSGPGGEKAAVKAAYFGYRVAIIEKENKFGGVSVNRGTLPSKSLKETAQFLSGKYEKGVFGVDRKLDRAATIEDFMFRKNAVVGSEAKAVFNNLVLHKVDIYQGSAALLDQHTVEISGENPQTIYSNHIIIATGSYPFHPENIPFDGKRIHDSDSILSISRLPRSICIVGAGVIGCEYATIFSNMGIKVYLVNRAPEIMPFIDQEVAKALVKQMEADSIELLFNDAVTQITPPQNEEETIQIKLESGRHCAVDMFLYAAGRCGNIKGLGCEKLGIKLTKRQTIEVDADYRTSVPNIYAVGDVIGFPSLASTSMDQGRVAVTHMFNTPDFDQIANVFPYGIYTIPEVSMVGKTEEEAKKEGLNYCVGRARYSDLPRGKIMGVKDGFMKIIFSKEDQVILGIHLIGPIATEVIHYGMSIIEAKKTISDVISTVFNYPTLHELYKYACYDGLGNLTQHKIKQ
jgi:NAD(P) transhydrogenase